MTPHRKSGECVVDSVSWSPQDHGRQLEKNHPLSRVPDLPHTFNGLFIAGRGGGKQVAVCPVVGDTGLKEDARSSNFAFPYQCPVGICGTG